MTKANKELANFEDYMVSTWHKVKGSAAHHIVVWDDPRALRARSILEKYKIHSGSAEIGMFLKNMVRSSI